MINCTMKTFKLVICPVFTLKRAYHTNFICNLFIIQDYLLKYKHLKEQPYALYVCKRCNFTLFTNHLYLSTIYIYLVETRCAGIKRFPCKKQILHVGHIIATFLETSLIIITFRFLTQQVYIARLLFYCVFLTQ